MEATRLVFRSFLAGSVLLALLGVRAEAKGGGARPPAPRDDAAYERLIQRLEMGMSALKELGRMDALEALGRIADQVRAERAAARKTREAGSSQGAEAKPEDVDRQGVDLEDIARRLEILRFSRDALKEHGKGDGAEVLSRAIQVGERQQRGEAPPEGVELSMANVIEWLRLASKLWDDRGWEGRARLARALADRYASRMGGEAQDDDDDESMEEGEAGEGHGAHEAKGMPLDDLANRVELLQVVRATLAEAGRGDAAEFLDRVLKVGRLQLEGGHEEELERAARDLPAGRLIELVRVAARLRNQKEDVHAAKLLAALADWYQRREASRQQEVEAAKDRAEPGADDLRAQLEALRKELDHLREQVERLGRSGR